MVIGDGVSGLRIEDETGNKLETLALAGELGRRVLKLFSLLLAS